MNAKIEEAFNQQLNEELYSAYLYLAISAHFEAENLKGMANWMRVQAQEEVTHAMKFYHFIIDRDGKVTLTEIRTPKASWKSPEDAFSDALSHEKKISSLINDLVDLSLKENEHAANTFLQWFVNEQVEEEANAKEILDKLKFVGDNKVAQFMIDNELGQRVFTPPAAAEE